MSVLKSRKKYLVIIVGPTAIGKTTAAIGLAKHFRTEIISADSRQFYREMNIGTAKPSAQELAAIPHHFINNLSIQDSYSVGNYERDVLAFLENYNKENNIAVMVGGTGLYINAVVNGLDEFPKIDADIKKSVEDDYNLHGLVFLQDAVRASDPNYYAKVDTQNPVRLIRALEVIRATGKPFSEFTVGAKVERNFIPIFIKLELDRNILYQRINLRVDEMINSGLVEEVEQLLPYQNLRTLQTVGYSELFDYFNLKITLAEAIEKIKQHTRNYAKRQITWFKRAEYENTFSPTDSEGIIKFVENAISL